MTDDVAALVLRDNTFQNQVLLYSRTRSAALLDEQGRYMRHLASRGRLNRRIEFLPNDEVLKERRQAGIGLTTPELAVLLAYNKMELYDQVLASDVPEDPYIATTLDRYFPALLRERFPQALQRHPLRREIIATHVVNSMINRVGPTFVHRLHEETGAAAADIVRAYTGTRQMFELVPLWRANEALDHQVPVSAQLEIIDATVRLLERGTVWLLQQRAALRDLDQTIRRFAPGLRGDRQRARALARRAGARAARRARVTPVFAGCAAGAGTARWCGSTRSLPGWTSSRWPRNSAPTSRPLLASISASAAGSSSAGCRSRSSSCRPTATGSAWHGWRCAATCRRSRAR